MLIDGQATGGLSSTVHRRPNLRNLAFQEYRFRYLWDRLLTALRQS